MMRSIRGIHQGSDNDTREDDRIDVIALLPRGHQAVHEAYRHQTAEECGQ